MGIFKSTSKAESEEAGPVPMDARLKWLLTRYALSALLATALVSGAIVTESYLTSLEDTLTKFQTLKINSVKMKETSRKEDETVASVKSIFRQYDKKEALEGAILTSVDAIKARMKTADILVENFDRKGDEITLPIVMTGVIHDYGAFVGNVGYLQSLMSPFFYMNSLSITNMADEKGALVNFEVRGAMRMQAVNIGDNS